MKKNELTLSKFKGSFGYILSTLGWKIWVVNQLLANSEPAFYFKSFLWKFDEKTKYKNQNY